MDFLSNSWVISFVTTVISSFFINSVVYFFKRKYYKKRIANANMELIRTVKNFVSEGQIPAVLLIESLSQAYSESNKVKRSEMINVDQVINHLLKDIFESNFISVQQKSDISKELMDLKEHSLDKEVENNEEASGNSNKYRWYMNVLIIMCICTFSLYSLNEIWSIFEFIPFETIMILLMIIIVITKSIEFLMVINKPFQSPRRRACGH
ncbi:hypothetical protein [Bacillus safensis]|uniref:hypothetical protein n=1 Tax=Bacillus safensis TaxID=561879 RepID=UPI0018CE698F|nr:hypothetical protein [Bacillus safensis]GMG79561.1 hypothetical protein ShirakiTA10_25230 [Bacillus safensis]